MQRSPILLSFMPLLAIVVALLQWAGLELARGMDFELLSDSLGPYETTRPTSGGDECCLQFA